MPRAARLSAPFARRAALRLRLRLRLSLSLALSLALRLRRNRWLRGGLQYPCEPVVFGELLPVRLRCLLSERRLRESDADHSRGNDAAHVRKDAHEHSRWQDSCWHKSRWQGVALCHVRTGRIWITKMLGRRPRRWLRCLSSAGAPSYITGRRDHSFLSARSGGSLRRRLQLDQDLSDKTPALQSSLPFNGIP